LDRIPKAQEQQQQKRQMDSTELKFLLTKRNKSKETAYRTGRNIFKVCFWEDSKMAARGRKQKATLL
jgi:hypothetical protein